VISPMLKDNLVESVESLLQESGFRTVCTKGSHSSFDVLGKREETLFLVKVLANVEGLSRESILELKEVAAILGGLPIVVSQRMKSSELADDIVYDRYGVWVSNVQTLMRMVNYSPPKIHSKRGTYCVQVDPQTLTSARQRLGLTQESLARQLGVSKQSIYRYESSGSMSLEVFKRMKHFFKEDVVQVEPKPNVSSLHFEHQLNEPGKASSFKVKVRQEFETMGFDTALTNAPFDIVATEDDRVFSVVSNDWRRLDYKLSVLEEISDIVGGYGVCISDRRVKSDVSVLTPQELSEIKTPKDLFKLLSGK
jgi:putative transcriptional regulator